MQFRRERKLRVRALLDMTPLIDVVFLLILFFLLSSTFVARTSIPIQAARSEGAPAYEETDLLVTLAYGPGGPGGKGPVYVNDEAIPDMAELSRVLAEAHAASPDLRVTIRPDARIPSARLIEVLGIARAAGLQRYSIAAEPIEPEPGK
jgi:biopolymer transport protein ExbD